MEQETRFSEKISVIVPCFNEEKTIFENLKKVHEYLSKHFLSFEIIAVNDGSRDNTVQEIEKAQKELPIRFINKTVNSGKGKAVRDGILASSTSSDIVAFADADLALPIEQLGTFVEAHRKGADIAIASRFVSGSKVKAPILWHRWIMERAFRCIRMLITNNFDIKDTQCGMKSFRRQTAFDIFPSLHINRFAFDAEIIYVAKKRHWSIVEIPVIVQNPIKSHVQLLRDPANMIADLIRIRKNDLMGYYENTAAKKIQR